MRTTRKVLLALVLTLCVAAVLSVCAFAAYDLDLDLPAGAVKGDAKWVDAEYADIDADGSGWIMIGGAADYSGTTESWPTIAKADFGRFYWNKTTDKGVFVVTGTNMSANWEDWSEISASTATGKRYAFAAAFVDVTLGYYGTNVFKNELSGANVAQDKEASIYVDGEKFNTTKYPDNPYVVYERYLKDYGKATQQWTNFAVTKASYDSYIAYKTELETAGKTGVELEDALVEFVYDKFSGYKISRNVKENGAFVSLALVWKKLQDAGYVFDTVEFRSKLTGTYMSTFGLTLRVLETKTLLFEDKITRLALNATDRGFLYDMDNLTTFAHVDFDDTTGAHAVTYTEGKIDLRGFSTVTSYTAGGVTYYTSHLLRNAEGPRDVVWFNTIKSGDVEVAGIIDATTFYGATKLETLTIPASVTLEQIRANAFNGCKALKVIDIKGSVSADAVVDAAAFTNAKQDIVVYVYSYVDEINASAAFAGFNNITVKNMSPIKNPFIAEGFQIRLHDYTGLRSIFTLSNSAVVSNGELGYDLVDYGTITFADKTLADSAYYNNDLGSLFMDALNGTSQWPNRVIKTSVKDVNRFVEVFDEGETLADQMYADKVGDKTFCITLTNIKDGNEVNEVWSVAYSVWENADGVIDYTFEMYVSENEDTPGKSSFSLYDVTIGMLANGIVNSANMDEELLFPVLKMGALTTSSFTSHTTPAQNGYNEFLNTDGSFTYWDVDYRKYTGGTTSAGWSFAPDAVEATSTTGVKFSILKNGAKYLVLITKSKTAAPEGVTYDYTIPSSGRSSDKQYYQPFHYKYGDMTKVSTNAKASLKVYSPAVTKAVFDNITAVVVDEGIVTLGGDSLTAITGAKTFVLPVSCIKINSYAISKNTALKDIIWTGDPDAKSESKYNVDHLYDLRGCTSLSVASFISDNSAAVNVVTAVNMNVDGQLAFNYANNLERYWSTKIYSGYTKPDSGVIDLSKSWHNTINKGFFNAGSKINTIMIQGTLKISHNTFKASEDVRSFRPLGRGQSFNFVLTDSNGKKIDYVWNGADGTGNTPFLTYLYKLIVDLHAGVIAAETANCDNLSVNGVSVQTIFPELYQ